MSSHRLSSTLSLLFMAAAAFADIPLPDGFRPLATGSWTGPLSNGAYRLSFQNTMTLNAPVDAAAAGTAVCLDFRALGRGQVSALAWINGTTTLVPCAWKTPDRLLFSTELPYRFIFSPVPAGATNVVVTISAVPATVREMRLSIAPSYTKPPNNEHLQPGRTLQPGYVEGRVLPVPAGQTDLASFAEAVAVDGSFEVRTRGLIDGSYGTLSKVPTVLTFPHPVTLSEIRLLMPSDSIFILADTTGTGAFETVLEEKLNAPRFTTWANLREYVWFVKTLATPLRVHSVLLVGEAKEVQLMGPAAELATLTARPELPAAPALSVTGPASTNYVEVAEKDRLYFGFTLEGWMFGTETHFTRYYQKGTPVPPLSEWPEWQKVLADYDYFHANFSLLFPPKTMVYEGGRKPEAKPRGTFPFPVLWPSKVWLYNQPFDVLSDINRSCAEHGIKTFVVPRQWLFNTNRTERLKQVLFAEEIASRGSDGVPICVDEDTFGVPPAGAVPAEDEEAFKKWSGQNRIPGRDAVSEKVRRQAYLYFRLKTAKWMADIKERSQKLNPKSLTFGAFAGCDYWKNRINVVSGYDIWGFEGRCDVIGGDGTYFDVSDRPFGTFNPAVETAVQVACTPRRMSMATLNYNWAFVWRDGKVVNPVNYDDHPDMCYTAGTLATYFNKGQFVDYWRYNYAVEYMDLKSPTVRTSLRDAGFMTKILAMWGGRAAQVPKDVLLLRSRTSEDWWCFNHLAGDDNKTLWQATQLAEAGFDYFFWTAARLVENAVPYEIYPMHRVETWKDIAKQYRVIVLPFAYSVSDAERGALKAAAAAGVKILAPGVYPLGVTDELGEPRAVPALDGIPVARMALDPLGAPNTEELQREFRRQLMEALGPEGPSVRLTRDRDRDVQVYRLDASPREALLLVANWSERPTPVNVGARLPRGRYRMEVCTADGVRTGRIGGKDVFSAAAAASFRMDLKKEDVRMLRFVPVRTFPLGAWRF